MNILSLGAGVQSTTLCLMSLEGELPLFDAAIFADTGAEPDEVYTHLDWIEEQIKGYFPLYRVNQGNIEADILNSLHTGSRCSQPPLYVKNAETQDGIPLESGGILWRQCTYQYKLRPIRKLLHELSEKRSLHVHQYIGISFDERGRCKSSDATYITNHYPLVERRIRRDDCLRWLQARGYPQPPKSACYFCPYHSSGFWREMKERQPELFARAVAFDHELRTGKLPGVTGDVYLHRNMIPLELAVKTDADNGQERLFDPYDCDGMCGV